MDQVKAFFYSCTFHILLLVFTVVNFSVREKNTNMHYSQKPMVNTTNSSIKANLINNQDVQAAIKRQEYQEVLQQKKIATEKANAQTLVKEAKKMQEEVIAKQKSNQELQNELLKQATAAKKLQKELEIAKIKLEKERTLILEQKKKANTEQERELKNAQINKKNIKPTSAPMEQSVVTKQENANEKLTTVINNKSTQNTVGLLSNGEENGYYTDDEAAKFFELIRQKIYANRVSSPLFSGLECTIRINILHDGGVGKITLLKGSGNSAYDVMAESAIIRSAPFPIPEDPVIFKRIQELDLNLCNDEIKYS